MDTKIIFCEEKKSVIPIDGNMYSFRAIGRVETSIIEAKKISSKNLSLSSCHIVSIPHVLYSDSELFTNLIKIDLSNNAITKIPDEFWSLVNIQVLNLRYNQLEVIENGIHQMTKLTHLDVSHNCLKKIPSGIVHLKNLTHLNLISNKIHHFDRSLLLMPNLSRLLISQNPMHNLSSELCQAGLVALRKHFKLGLHYYSPRSNLRLERTRGVHSASPNKVCLQLLRDSKNKSIEELNDLPNNEETISNDNEGIVINNETLCNNRSSSILPELILNHGSVEVKIPSHRSHQKESDFKIEVVKDRNFHPHWLDNRTVLASPVLSLSPHGVTFGKLTAEICLPISVTFDHESEIKCFCSNTDIRMKTDWQEVPRTFYSVNAEKNCVILRTTHFSLFCAILSKPLPKLTKTIPKEGGEIQFGDVQGARLQVPEKALRDDTEITMEILFDDGQYAKDSVHTEPMALATPVVKLEPSGLQFSTPVKLTLPIPDCAEIQDQFELDSTKDLTLWYARDESLQWEEMIVNYEVRVDSSGLYTLSFPIQHFSWYKALWKCIAKTVHKAKLGCAYYYPSIQFSMMCKAMIDYQAGSPSFGLEVLCYRSDESPDIVNLKPAGGSLKPRMVKTGDLIVKLISNCFEADVENGEVRDLKKYEFNFKGYEFEKQFACLDIKLPKNRGVFGKVFVERELEQGVTEPLFEFNLIKKEENKDAMSVIAIQELAEILCVDNPQGRSAVSEILDIDRSESIAKILAAHQQNGGTADRFVEVLYEVARSRRQSSLSSRESFLKSADSSGSLHSGTSSAEPSPRKCRRRSSRPVTPDDVNPFDDLFQEFEQPERSAPKRKRPDDVIDGCAILPSKRQCCTEADTFTEKFYNDKTELEDRQLWMISEGILHKWRAVARSFDLPETDIVCFEQKYPTDYRECAYQMLLTFKSQFPELCTFGYFYRKLCEAGLKREAQKYCIN